MADASPTGPPQPFISNQCKDRKDALGSDYQYPQLTVSGTVMVSTITGGFITLSQGRFLCLPQAVVNWEEWVGDKTFYWVGVKPYLLFLHPLIPQAFNSTKGKKSLAPQTGPITMELCACILKTSFSGSWFHKTYLLLVGNHSKESRNGS